MAAAAVAATVTLALPAKTAAQETAAFLQRLPSDLLDVAPPSSRVRGTPGGFELTAATCGAEPAPDVRRRIVDLVVQEWAYFGFAVMDETDPSSWARPRGRPPEAAAANRASESGPGGPLRADGDAAVDPERQAELLRRSLEAARVAPSIAGYWAVTGDGAWIVERHNDAWESSNGNATRWRDAWSAAFISWVMCEAGFGDRAQFERHVAHHVYVDQAIRARDGLAPEAVFVAHELGEQPIVPGDLVCMARRPAYRTLADRRAQLGEGARTHCDFVVKVDEERSLLLAIGGNVRGTVGLKMLPAERRGNGPLRPVDRSSVAGAATTFVHLKLEAEPIEPGAFDTSPTLAALAALSCASGAAPALQAQVIEVPAGDECTPG